MMEVCAPNDSANNNKTASLLKKQFKKLSIVRSENELAIKQVRERISKSSSKDIAQKLASLDDGFILKYLRARDFDTDASYQLIKYYFQMRKSNPEMFRTVKDVRDIFESQMYRILPHRGRGGETIFVVRAGQWDVSKWSAADTLAASVTALELSAMEEETQTNGIIEVMDIRGFSLSMFLRINPFVAKIGADLTDRCLPLKFKRIHVINGNRFLQLAWAMVRPLLSDEIKQKIIFHGSNLDELYRDVAPELLPEQVGGSWVTDDKLDMSATIDELDEKLRAYWKKYSP